MDLLNTTYNKLERLAVSADEWLTAALRHWESWSTCRKLAALDDRQLRDIGLSGRGIERIAGGEAAAGRSAEEAGYADDRSRQAVRTA